MKILLTALIGFSLMGCAKPCAYPEIKTIPIIESIDINVSHGTIDANGTKKVILLIRQLRKSESYYFDQITEYNKRFMR